MCLGGKKKREKVRGKCQKKKRNTGRQKIWSEGLGACLGPLTETDGVGATRFSGGSSL